MRASLLEVRSLHVDTPEGRPLFRGLSMSLARERVALVGRNGVGKSTLLQILSGDDSYQGGTLDRRTEPWLVPQRLEPGSAGPLLRGLLDDAPDPIMRAHLAREVAAAGLRPLPELASSGGVSRGELRKLHLLAALAAGPDLLLLDEPTQDLDEVGQRWLRGWLAGWRDGLMLVSHDRRLLRGFSHFFIVAESGCRYFPGSLAELERELEREADSRQRAYARNLNVLSEREQHSDTVRRRRLRKKRVGRLRELGRCQSRARLNTKRSRAQLYQGKREGVREERLAAVRSWVRGTRRALEVTLPLELPAPALPAGDGGDLVRLEGVACATGGRVLFEGLDLALGRHRLAITGPNGAGKTTLLRVMLGEVAPSAGTADVRLGRLGSIAQGATDWMSSESLIEHLPALDDSPESIGAAAALLVSHKFPLALAQRPLSSLSSGERLRAALICLFRRPGLELLVLDEPTDNLDMVGYAALRRSLQAWQGGLVVVTHDTELIESIGVGRRLALDGHGGHELSPLPPPRPNS